MDLNLSKIVAAIGSGASDVQERPRATCTGGCGKPVAERGAWCEPCATQDRAERRRAWLRNAYASLPRDPDCPKGRQTERGGWDWARYGDPIYEAIAAKTPALHAAVKEWRRRSGSMALLGWVTGSGKTAAVVALAHRMLDAARDNPAIGGDDLWFAAGIRFVPAIDLATARKEHRLGAGEPPLLEAAVDARLLILDELGYLEARHDITAIQEVIDARYRAARPTIYTSGATKAQLAEVYGHATVRRIELGKLVTP